MTFQGSVALVTAAAGAGIGRATAERLARAGATLVVTDKHAERTEETSRQIEAQSGGVCIGIPLDVTDEEAIGTVIRDVVEKFGRLDAVVNNSGITRLAPIWETTTEAWNEVLDVSLTSHFWIMRESLRYMVENGSGAIVNVSSVSGWMGAGDGSAPYAAAKAGVMGLTRAAAAEAAPYGVRVNAVAPGLAYNEFLRKIYPQEHFDDFISATPMGRAGTPEEIAAAIAFLLSEEAGFVVGEVMSVSGGMYMRA